MTVYPIAEIFQSPQGEGQWQGSYFTFVRFAGCNVGKPYTVEQRAEINAKLVGSELPILSSYQERCETQLGVSFSCDTRYSMSTKKSLEEIVAECNGAPRVCLTGGEPLLHDLRPLIKTLLMIGKKVHIETSGTRPFTDLRHYTVPKPDPLVWVAVSPKVGCLPEAFRVADELKILVGPEFDEPQFITLYSNYMEKVWLQPINYEHTINMDNMKLCLDLQKRHPLCRISSQAHKTWAVR